MMYIKYMGARGDAVQNKLDIPPYKYLQYSK